MVEGRCNIYSAPRKATLFAAGWALVATCACGTAVARPGPGPTGGPPTSGSTEPEIDDGTIESSPPTDSVAPRPAPEPLPQGRDIAALGRERCLAILEARDVEHEVVDSDDAPGVDAPVLLRGPIGGVEVTTRARGRARSIMDCRMAVALLAWAPTLRDAGVRAIDHMSIYRPGARVRRTGRRSGHALGLAFDAGTFVLDDGRRLEVEEVWTDRRRRAPPCEPRPADDADQALLRSIVCAAAAQDLFQVVLTPHFDRDHRNHVHLELKPGVTWSCLH